MIPDFMAGRNWGLAAVARLRLAGFSYLATGAVASATTVYVLITSPAGRQVQQTLTQSVATLGSQLSRPAAADLASVETASTTANPTAALVQLLPGAPPLAVRQPGVTGKPAGSPALRSVLALASQTENGASYSAPRPGTSLTALQPPTGALALTDGTRDVTSPSNGRAGDSQSDTQSILASAAGVVVAPDSLDSARRKADNEDTGSASVSRVGSLTSRDAGSPMGDAGAELNVASPSSGKSQESTRVVDDGTRGSIQSEKDGETRTAAVASPQRASSSESLDGTVANRLSPSGYVADTKAPSPVIAPRSEEHAAHVLGSASVPSAVSAGVHARVGGPVAPGRH